MFVDSLVDFLFCLSISRTLAAWLQLRPNPCSFTRLFRIKSNESLEIWKLSFSLSLSLSLAADVTKSCKCHTYREKLRRKSTEMTRDSYAIDFFLPLNEKKWEEKGGREQEIYKNERKEVKREREKRNELHLLWEMEVTLMFLLPSMHCLFTCQALNVLHCALLRC